MREIRHDERPEGLSGAFRTDALARALYSEGAGIARAIPSAVAVPRHLDDVAALMQWARVTGHALMPRGSASGMAAGAIGPHVAVDLTRFRDVDDVDRTARTVRVGAGILRNEIDAIAARAGLRFPVDPSSGAFCTIGGMCATNAAGARSLRVGATREWIHGIRCVWDDGSDTWIRRGAPWPLHVPAVARLATALSALRRNAPRDAMTHRVRKESSGYHLAPYLVDGTHAGPRDAPHRGPHSRPHSGPRDGTLDAEPAVLATDLVDLLVGSEGTLAIFTDVEVLLEPRPTESSTVLAQFASLDRAAECAQAARLAGAAACEMLDRTYLDVAERNEPTGIAGSVQAVLLIAIEAFDEHDARRIADAVAQACRSTGASEIAIAHDRADEERLWTLRHAASPTLSRLPASMRSMQFIEDGCVPPDRFADYVRGVRRALDATETPGVIFGHAGDAHAHVNPLIDVTRPTWRERVRTLLDEVCNLTASLGGTLAGEHGDGRLRAPLLPRVWSPLALAAFANVKAAADPAGILNPGCKIATGANDGLEAIRYDPALPALPAAARTALGAIERDRAWQAFRLDFAGP